MNGFEKTSKGLLSIQFGRYELLDRISGGNTVEVFRGRVVGAGGFEKIVAVKRILPHLLSNADFVELFIEEAKICALLNHSNIGQIFEFGRVEDQYFIAMEYIHGLNLSTIIDFFSIHHQSVSAPMAIHIILEISNAVEYAHHKRAQDGAPLQIVHGDICPSNILISFEGAVKLIDFGFTRALTNTRKTPGNEIIKPSPYLSPERINGQAFDQRADIYAMGMVLWELVTGRRLMEPEGRTKANTPNQIAPPSFFNQSVPQDLDDIILRAMAPDVEKRYQGAEDLHEDLEAFLHTHELNFNSKQLSRFMKQTFCSETLRPKAPLVQTDSSTTISYSNQAELSGQHEEETIGKKQTPASVVALKTEEDFPEALSVSATRITDKSEKLAAFIKASPSLEAQGALQSAETRVSNASNQLAVNYFIENEPKAELPPPWSAQSSSLTPEPILESATDEQEQVETLIHDKNAQAHPRVEAVETEGSGNVEQLVSQTSREVTVQGIFDAAKIFREQGIGEQANGGLSKAPTENPSPAAKPDSRPNSQVQPPPPSQTREKRKTLPWIGKDRTLKPLPMLDSKINTNPNVLPVDQGQPIDTAAVLGKSKAPSLALDDGPTVIDVDVKERIAELEEQRRILSQPTLGGDQARTEVELMPNHSYMADASLFDESLINRLTSSEGESPSTDLLPSSPGTDTSVDTMDFTDENQSNHNPFADDEKPLISGGTSLRHLPLEDRLFPNRRTPKNRLALVMVGIGVAILFIGGIAALIIFL